MLSIPSLKINLYNALMGGASGSALSLDFLSGTLDSRITFTRGSNATLVDATGKITYAPANFFTYSQEFDNAAWLKQAGGTASVPVVTANAGTAPDGTETADRVQMTLNGGTTVSDAANVYQAAAYPAGSILQSIWLRSNTGANQTVLLVIGNTQPGGGLVTVTPTWQRFAVTQSVAAAGSSNSGIRLRGTFTGNTADILVWGAQLEPVTYQTTPSTYNVTTSAAYYGPRFDYDPVTLAPKGLLIEEQRTNILLYSEQFNNVAGWSFFNATVNANVTVSPDGTANGDALVENATAGTHVCQQFVNYAISTAYTFSVYVKAGTRTWVILSLPSAAFGVGVSSYYNLTGAGSLGTATGSPTSRTITAAGNGWYRITITATTTLAAGGNTVIGAASADNTSFYTGVAAAEALYLYGGDIEVGAFATSYIPTVASQVTRSADIATMTGTNFSSWFNQTEGTIVTQSSNFSTASFPVVAAINDGTLPNRIVTLSSTTTQNRLSVVTGGVNQADFPFSNYVTGTIASTALAIKANDFAGSVNGATVQTDTSGTVPTVTQMQLGAQEGGLARLNGHIRQIAYFNTRLSDAQLQALTQPDATLSLNFISSVYEV